MFLMFFWKMFTSVSSARRVATIIQQKRSNKHYLPSVSHSLHHSYCLFEEVPQQCVSNFYHFYHCGSCFFLLSISQEYSHSSEFYMSSLQIIFQHKSKKKQNTKTKEREKEIPFGTFCLVSPLTNSSERRGWMEALRCCSKHRAHYFALNQISVKQ